MARERAGNDAWVRCGCHDNALLGSGVRTHPNPQKSNPFITHQVMFVSHIFTLLLPLVGAATVSKRAVLTVDRFSSKVKVARGLQ